MGKIKTANFFYEDALEESGMMSKEEQRRIAIKAMVEFAKYHVEQALLKAAEDCDRLWVSDGESTGWWEEVNDKDSILNSYPLSNIK